MLDELQIRAEQYKNKHRRHKVWQRIVFCLSCVVAFCTTCALILPAITMEQTAYCGMEEHQHTDECYEKRLTCGFGELQEGDVELLNSGHIHSDACYEEQKVLVCGQEESAGHIHDDSCIRHEQVLICTKDHEHTEDCYEISETYICGMTEGEGSHTHGAACDGTQKVLVCETPVSAETFSDTQKLHVHTDDCYENVLVCQKTAHEHTLACYSNPDADLESASVWAQSVSNVELTGIWADDVISVAKSQLGYRESTANYIVMDDEETTRGITRYGQWYGDPYGDWCAMFVSFCLRYAEIPNFPYCSSCPAWLELLSSEQYGLYVEAGEHEPMPGEVIFFDMDGNSAADHVGLVAGTNEDGNEIRTIEGNHSNRVQYVDYTLDDSRILGFARLPEKETGYSCGKPAHTHNRYCYGCDGSLLCPIDEHVHSDACRAGLNPEEKPASGSDGVQDNPDNFDHSDKTILALSDDFLYENDQFSIALHVEGNAYLQDTPLEAIRGSADDLQPYEITPATEPQQNTIFEPDSDSLQNDAETTGDGGLQGTADKSDSDKSVKKDVPVLVVTEMDDQQREYQHIASTLEEEYTNGLLDLSVLSLEFYCQDALLDVSTCSVTAQITPQTQMMETAQTACAELEADAVPDAETGVVFSVVEATEDGTEELDSAIVNTSTQEIPVLTASVDGNGILAVAATQTANPKFTVQYYAWLDEVADSGSTTDTLPVIDTSGGNLPQNGITPATKTLFLEETASGSGVYGIKTTSTLIQVYRSHEYQYITAPNLTYFNRLYENGHYAIKEIWILQDGKDAESVSREDWNVYDPAATHFTNRSQSANDNTVLITDGTVIRLVFDTTESIYTNAVNFYDYDITNDGVHTAAQGINSASNYSGSGAKLAFGNNNTDTGLAGETWSGNTLNKANSNGYSGCTFGLVTGLNGGEVQYAGGVDAPALFNDGNAAGKTSYENGQYTLSFDRSGDTYILSSVGGTTSATSLQTFTSRWNWNNTRKIWSNHFWPMDNVTNTDPHTGTSGNTGTYIGTSGKEKNYPASDNGIAHNNMFGMTYKVQFTLTEDYTGPLEYYFFGDDDMWVFLDGRLVCDIGGVHSSVGEYVNLWDYVAMGSSGMHTLSFFYTERGLSGSTCYMQFTLPSVSSITPEQNTGLLTVQKLVKGTADSDEEFCFEIMFTDENGRPLPDDYSYTRYTADGTVVKQDIIIYDGGSFELKAGEYIIINYLPYGTKYSITETNAPYYTVTCQVDGGVPNDGYTATGQIPTSGNGSVVFTNTAMPVLPSTGGYGTILYTAGGFLLTMAALLLLYKNGKRKTADAVSPDMQQQTVPENS